ncbi:unnamed protein product [Cuscuta campestris]|uniref:DUF7870 domain-containing protein n=1 Tax=Cuscuta campestris TaxID=132261 RepID=A0A484MRN0_9ASTE|nr:unnamed protein product [Cuscuta campestris]
MDLKALKWQVLRGSLMRRLLLKMLMFGAGVVIVSLAQLGHDVQFSDPWMPSIDNGCGLNFSLSRSFFKLAYAFGVVSIPCRENRALAKNVFEELMVTSFLDSDVKSLCVGEGADEAVLALRELGFSDVSAVNRHPFFSLAKRRFVYELDYDDGAFDFVFSGDLGRVSVPALLVLEIERVLRPGGSGAVLLGTHGFYSGNLVTHATPVSSFLKSSDVAHVGSVGPFTLVLFKKRFEESDAMPLFERFKLPDHCPSVANNKPLIPFLEPLVNDETNISYLPRYMNVSSRNKLVYINVGAGELVDMTITTMLNSSYHFPRQALDAYVIDHNAYALSLYVKTPGITFVYHPGLAGEEEMEQDINYTDEDLEEEEDEFDFIRWFNETVSGEEEPPFVVLMMNARPVELQILDELFRTGLICHVDELFLRCSDTTVWKPARCGDCVSLLKSLRNSGVFAHWF